MHAVHFWEVICFTFINILLCFAQADVVKHCDNSTNSTTCSYTYEQLYKNLTKSENSFNISNALYPGRGKPSFLVKVNVYGPDKTTFPIPALYTWSIHCLYATVPGPLLEVLSLWSIFVTSRTQELNIQIPLFCCNVSDDKKKREEKIEEFLTRAITELQDLAVSPGIRDPSLNTAECIRQCHKPTMDHTGRTAYIRAMLWCSLVLVLFCGPLLAKCIKEVWDLQKGSEISMEKKNIANAICFSFYILAVVGYLVLTVAFGLSCFYRHKGQATFDIIAIITVIFGYSVILSIVITVKYCSKPYPDYSIKSCCQKCCLWMACFLKVYFLICGANLISYLFCWLIIGIRINPTWGLTIALLVISVSAAVTYARYLHREATNTTDSHTTSNTQVSGQATVDIPVNGQATGDIPVSGQATSNTQVSGQATGDTPVSGQATSDIPISGQATSNIPVSGQASGNTSVSGQAASNTSISSNAASNTTGSDGDKDPMVTFFCVSGCLVVLLLFVIIVLSSYSGSQMAADEVLKTTTLYFIGAFISWVTWKKHASYQLSVQITHPTSNTTPPNPEENRHGRTQETTRLLGPEELPLMETNTR